MSIFFFIWRRPGDNTIKFCYDLRRTLNNSNKTFSLGTLWGWPSWEHPCWHVTVTWRLNILDSDETRGSQGLDTTWLNSRPFFLVTFSAKFLELLKAHLSELDPTEEWLLLVEFSSAPITGSLPHTIGAPASLTERQFFPGEKHSAYCFSDTGL